MRPLKIFYLKLNANIIIILIYNYKSYLLFLISPRKKYITETMYYGVNYSITCIIIIIRKCNAEHKLIKSE